MNKIFSLILLVFILESCSYFDKSNKVTSKNESLIELNEDDLNQIDIRKIDDTVIISSIKNGWEKRIPFINSNIINSEILLNSITDNSDSSVYLNLYDISLLRIRLVDGVITHKFQFTNQLRGIKSKPVYLLKSDKLLLCFPKQILIFDKDLKLLLNVSQQLEIDKLNDENVIINDTIYFDRISNESMVNDPFFNDKHSLVKLNVLNLSDYQINISAEYQSSESDTTVYYSIVF